MAEPRQGDGRGLGPPEQTEEAAPLNTSATNFTRTHGFILSDSAPTALECGWWIFSPLGNPQPDMAAFTFRDLNVEPDFRRICPGDRAYLSASFIFIRALTNFLMSVTGIFLSRERWTADLMTS